VFEEILQQGKFSSGVIITFQVMAFTRVSPRHPNAIGSVHQGSQNEFRAYPGRARDPDGPYVRRVLNSIYSGQIAGGIAAPAAQEGRNLWFPIIHKIPLISSELNQLKLKVS